MLKLVQKINHKWGRTARAEPSGATPMQRLPRKPGTSGDRWTRGETYLLLECEQTARPVQVQIASGLRGYETTILGVDLLNNQLLVGSLFPAPPVAQLGAEQPFWLVIGLEHGEYRLCVQPRELLAGGAQRVEIITTQFIDMAKPVDCVEFGSKGPAIRVRAASGLQLSGIVKQLGRYEALIQVFAREDLKPGTEIECAVTFNERFQLHFRGRVSRDKQLRTSGGGRMLQLELAPLKDDDELQLRAYLSACATRPEAAA